MCLSTKVHSKMVKRVCQNQRDIVKERQCKICPIASLKHQHEEKTEKVEILEEKNHKVSTQEVT